MKQRPWKRMIVKLLLFLLAGAIVNVAVAISCAIWSNARPEKSLGGSMQQSESWDGWFEGTDSVMVKNRHFGRGISWMTVHGLSQKYDANGHLVYWVNGEWIPALEAPQFVSREFQGTWFQCGYPMLALQGGEAKSKNYGQNPPDERQLRIGGGWLNQDKNWPSFVLSDKRFVPILPRWPGFIGNTVLFAVLAWLIVVTFTLVRWIRRMRGGRCLSCGYDLRGSPLAGTCPECGVMMKQNAETQKA